MTLADAFTGCLVINLPDRADRRRLVGRELAALGAPAGWAEYFPAVRPDGPGGFPSVGARGCFLSHLGVLRLAAARGWGSVLIMEDDLEIDPAFAADPGPVLDGLRGIGWDLAYLGHLLPRATDPGPPLRRCSGPLMTTHFLGVNGRCFAGLIRFLEDILARPPGHSDGGPMHVDGAYTTFRARNPDVVTLVTAASVGRQRPSRSDVSPGWKDQTPVVRSLVAAGRRVWAWTGGRRP